MDGGPVAGNTSVKMHKQDDARGQDTTMEYSTSYLLQAVCAGAIRNELW
jgi:hypothetical protein